MGARTVSAWRGHGWTVALSIAVYLALLTVTDAYEPGTAERLGADQLALGVPSGLLAILAVRYWGPPVAAWPGAVARRLVIGGLALLSLSGLVGASLALGGVSDDFPPALGLVPLVALGSLIVGALGGSVARGREGGATTSTAVRRSLLVVLLVAIGIFGLQAGFEADVRSVEELPWLLLFSVLLAVPAFGQLRRPDASPAATLLVASVLVLHAVGPTLAGYIREDVLAQVLVGVALALVALHPAKSSMRAIAPRPALTALGAAGAVPIAFLAARSAAETVRLGAGGEEVMTVFAFSLLAGIILACLRTPGSLAATWAVGIAVGVLGAASAFAPHVAGSWGRSWGLVATVWSAAFVAVALRTHDRQRAGRGLVLGVGPDHRGG